ncbi:MAG: metallophosphoesterase, partial [Candidatus Omnitrophica bacterium]|nr:metallophosphoesterase [Candidatus Omnitrophota bacterium]
MPIPARQIHGKSLSVRSPTLLDTVLAELAKMFQSTGLTQPTLLTKAGFYAATSILTFFVAARPAFAAKGTPVVADGGISEKEGYSKIEVIKKFSAGVKVELKKILMAENSKINVGEIFTGKLLVSIEIGEQVLLDSGVRTSVVGNIEIKDENTLYVHTQTSIYEVKIKVEDKIVQEVIRKFKVGVKIQLRKILMSGNSQVGIGESFKGRLLDNIEIGKQILLDIGMQTSRISKVEVKDENALYVHTQTSIYEVKIENIETSDQFEELLAIIQLGEVIKSRGKYQKGALVDLRNLPADVEPIIVGDLHTKLRNLKGILAYNDNISKIQRGEAILVILGDAVHSEEDLSEMESSVEIMRFIMDLKIKNPDNVYYVVGNHDYLSGRFSKSGVVQGLVYREKLKKLFGDEYVKLYEEFIKVSPLMLIGNGLVAAHAGPVKRMVSLSDIGNVDVSDENNPIVEDLTWGRFRQDGSWYYDEKDVERFLSNIGQPNAIFIVAHSPSLIPRGEFHAELIPNRHHVIFAGRNDVFGYASFKEGKVKFIPVATDGGEVKQIERISGRVYERDARGQTKSRYLQQLLEKLKQLLKTFYSSPFSGVIRIPIIIAVIILSQIVNLIRKGNFTKKSEAYPAATEIIINSPNRFPRNSRLPFVQNGSSIKEFITQLSYFVKYILTLTTTSKEGGASCPLSSSKASGSTTSSTPLKIIQPLLQLVNTVVTRLESSWLKIQALSMPIPARQIHGKSLSVRSPT